MPSFNPRVLLVGIVCTLSSSACGVPGQTAVSYPAYAARLGPASFTVGSWQVTLDTAELGLGPIYFCTTAAASSELCPAAAEEFAAVAVVDLLSPSPVPIGSVSGLSAELRSAAYDFAYSWFATASSAAASPQAPGGHSARFAGRAERAGLTLRFSADVDIVPQIQGENSVQGSRLFARIDSSRYRLDIGLRPDLWWQAVDFDDLARLGQTDIVIASGSRAMNALIVAMTAGDPPSFTWSSP